MAFHGIRIVDGVSLVVFISGEALAIVADLACKMLELRFRCRGRRDKTHSGRENLNKRSTLVLVYFHTIFLAEPDIAIFKSAPHARDRAACAFKKRFPDEPEEAELE